MSGIEERLEEILDEMAVERCCEHGIMNATKSAANAKQAIKDLILEEVIGIDESFTGNGGKYPEVRNGLRHEQRQALTSLIRGEK